MTERAGKSILDAPLSPLSATQAEAVVRLLIDVYYGSDGPQAIYHDIDRREMKGRLAEALSDGCRADRALTPDTASAIGKGRIPDGAIHTWFSLTYANYLVCPRSVLQSMPLDWQDRFVALLEEMHEAFGHLDWPDYTVRAVGERGRFKKDPIPQYNRGRTRVEPRP